MTQKGDRHMVKVDELFVIMAVRYALSRQSYVVASTVDSLRNMWDQLPTVTRNTIHTDIKAWLKVNNRDLLEYPIWYNFSSWANRQNRQKG